MSRRITQAEEKVERVIVELREIARSGDEGERKLAAVERELWTTLLALGRALLVLFLARRAGRDRPFVYSHQGGRYFVDKSKEMSNSIGTLYRVRCRRRPNDHPAGLGEATAAKAQARRAARESRRQKRKTHEKCTRAKGVKNKNSKAAVIGVVYTLVVKDGIVEGPINKRIIATHESHEKLFELLEVEAKKRGYGVKQSVFLSDGSEHILERQRRFFSEAIPCLDWCHAAEYLWKACSAFHPEGSAKLQNVASRLKGRMLDGHVDGVISTLEDVVGLSFVLSNF